MAILDGRAGALTERDQELIQSIFFARYLSTQQIAWLYFNSTSRTKTRLADLFRKGWISNKIYAGRPPAWFLTRDGFEEVASSLRIQERWTPKQLGPVKMPHYIETNDLYVRLKLTRKKRRVLGLPDSKGLDEILGPYPGWEWRDERRAHVEYINRAQNVAHQSDAHILIHQYLFIVERQSERSKKTFGDIEKKMADHASYLSFALDNPDDGIVLFVYDRPHDADLARRAADRHGISIFAGQLEETVQYVSAFADQLV